jgi:anti-sigma B factor antagonist
VIRNGELATIILGEKLVASDVPQIKNEMKGLIGEGVVSMSLDCTQLSHMDSTGIGCLVAAHNTLVKLNGSLSLVNVSMDIYDLLCSMRLDRHIQISPLTTPQE